MKKNLSFLKIVLALCSILSFGYIQAQTYNFITSGDMEHSNWTGVPGKTDLIATSEASSGIDGTTSLKVVSANLGGDSYYVLRCEDVFSMTKSDKITVSFWARGSADNMHLQPWVQESDGNQWMNFGDAYLTTNWKQYTFTTTVSTPTSGNYKLKFRGYNTGTMYIDNVVIGPVDYEDVNQSGIYEVTVSQDGKTWPLNVFRNSCPAYQAGYQNMDPKDKIPLDYFAGRSINWTKFSFGSPITVHVKVNNTDKVPVNGQTVNVYPSRYGVTSTTSGNVVTFTITEPGQYSVEIGANGYKNGLVIFADPLETDIPSKTNPDYLVLYDATSADLSSIPASYNGVYFRRGVHNIGIWNIPSNIKNVYFEDGSWVYGALNMNANPDVRIYGRGVLSSYKMNYRQAHCVEAINGSDRITLEGLVVADPKYFSVRLIGTNNKVSYTKVIGGWVFNCDGISAFEGSTVSKCFIWANDDAIKIYRDNIKWSDIVVWQLNNGGIIQMSWGGAVGGSHASNVTVERLDVLRAEWNVDRFNVGLLNCVGNRYQEPGRSDLLENWLIQDVVTENPIPIIWNITPDAFTPCHINGLTMKNWNVRKDNSLGFVNRIKGMDANKFLSGFVFDNVRFNNGLMTNENRINSGDMDNGNWVSVPNGTDHTTTFCAACGTGNDQGMLSKTTNMNGKPYYTNVCGDEFHVDNNEMLTISFFARATAAGKLLTPFIQDVESGDMVEFPQVTLTTGYQRYASTVKVDKRTSDQYKLKFRGFSTAWIYLDKVQIGRKDWITLTGIEKQYLNTPTFLPVLPTLRSASIQSAVNQEFTVYPNPASDVLMLRGADKDTTYKVYTLTGSLILSGKGAQVDVSTLNKGVYVLKTNDNKQIKFVKR